ncbi:DinB family protein [Paenibacillus filicis]|uniref:DinB family protein n=1 Tax=Paenibacillus filicis TaxID=669464 RepID=A0ABU9DPC9_9BACL
MTTTEVLQRFEETVSVYIHELGSFSLDQLQHKPSHDEWSIGQMVQHLINSALYMQLRHVDQCLLPSQDLQVTLAQKNEDGIAIFAQGSFPPIRVHVPPSPQYTPDQPESKEQLIQGLHTVVQRMKEVEPALHKASNRHTIPHPRFGGLCAEEWFRLVEMHYRHHLLQLDRLKQSVYGKGEGR